MDRRLEALLSMDRLEGVSRVRRLIAGLKSQANLLNFYLRDVRPAIAARRRAPQGDVISHLLEGGRKNVEILIECVTYGAAGMVTTRESISMAAWHLLEREELRSEYLAGDEKERYGILHEILRLEPVVGRLYRRATADMEIEDGGVTHRVPAGAMLNLDIRSANADVEVVGDHLGETVGFGERQVVHTRHITHDHFGSHGSVGDDVGHAIVAVFFAHVIDHLAPAAHAKIDIEVGRGDAFGIEETFEE